ncbi:hypothetical protein [Candidatus Poriferisodalis sp.]|uniref:hypothetical protein n=1 Tax=Candidatus Poriferisodalis sp. TaxID=3101277 RepID=UPI003B0166B7
MPSHECPGLPAEWLNAWLAAVGVTVLVPDMRLSWTDSASPHAVLHAPDGSDPIDLLVDAWPTKERIDDMPIADSWRDIQPYDPKMSIDDFRNRARYLRSHGHSDHWSLSSIYTDLFVNAQTKDHAVGGSKFAPGVPGKNNLTGKGRTIYSRLAKVHSQVSESRIQVIATLAGHSRRVEDNGLGFDFRRITALADDSKKRVDAVIEVLAFFGLALFPIRGIGVIKTATNTKRSSNRNNFLQQRNWIQYQRNGSLRFVWPAWRVPLTRAAIDALLDAWSPTRRGAWSGLEVHNAWQSLEFNASGDDRTRGIGSESL